MMISEGDRVMDVSRKFYGDKGTVQEVFASSARARVQWDAKPPGGSYWATSDISTLKIED